MKTKLLTILKYTFKKINPNISLSLVSFLLKNTNSYITNSIIRILLDNIENKPIKSRNGYYIYFKSSGHSTSLRKEIILGNHENEYLKIFIKIIPKNSHVIDVGAHEGSISLFLNQLVGKKGKVYSFEPNKENLQFLYKNKCYNEANMQIFETAISNKKEKSNFIYSDGYGAWGSLSHHSYNTNWIDSKQLIDEVQVDTLDNIFEHINEKISFIKIDTEGNELNVVLGARNILKNHCPIVCFEVNLTFWAYNNQSIDLLFNLFTQNNYILYTLQDKKLKKFKSFDKRLCNMFAIPNYLTKTLYEYDIIKE